MINGWLKKVCLALMLTLALGTAACGVGQEFEDSENFENIAEEDAGSDDGSVTFFEGGSITDTGGGISASFDDGTSFFAD